MSNWICLLGAQDYHLSGPQLRAQPQPSLVVIGQALAKINRYTGHTVRPYSVAEHSLAMQHYARLEGDDILTQWLCLMHDAHECVTGDVSSPVKAEIAYGIGVVRGEWTRFEHSIEQRFLQPHFPSKADTDSGRAVFALERCRYWDLVALATERRDLLEYNSMINAPWPVIDGPEPIAPHRDRISTDDQDWRAIARRWTTYAHAVQQQLEAERPAALAKIEDVTT